MQWIKEVETVESVDDLEPSCSIRGIRTPNENYADLFTIAVRNDDIQEFDSKSDGILLPMTKIPSDDILEGLYKLRTRESQKVKTVLELYNMEIHQKKAGSDYHRLKTMVKRSIEQNLQLKNFESRFGNYERNAVVKNPGTKQRGQRTLGDCWQWKANGQCSKGDNCSFRHDINKRAKMTQPNPSPSSFMQQIERNASRTRSPRGKSPSGRMFRWLCKDYLKGTCTTPFCEKWHPPECLFHKSGNGCRFGEKCAYAHRQVDEQPSKKSQKNGDKSALAMLKITRQLGCLSQETEPPKSSSILRKSSNVLKPIRCIRFTEALLRHACIRDQNPSLGMICPGDPHQRNPNAPKFEDRSQEETEWQEQGAREAAWKLAKNVLKLKEKHKTAFFSPSENWYLPAPSNLKPEEREFVVDSGALMHMISKKDLNSTELETVKVSKSPTTVITANGEVQTHGEATVYVKELDVFLTMKVLENTPAVLSLGKLCDEHGYSYEWINGQKPHLVKNGIRIQCNTENFAPIVVPGLSTSSSSCSRTSPPMAPARQEIDHPTSSSSSSTSPTTTVSSDSETREREDLSWIDSHPVPVTISHVDNCVKRKCGLTRTGRPVRDRSPSRSFEWQERGDPCSSEISEEQLLTKPTKNQ